MSSRGIIIIAAISATLAAGCGKPPSAQFVNSERMKTLMREAQRPVQTVLDEGFGTPNDLVAWRKLPVDFGELDGTVIEKKENSLTKFKADLKPKTPQADDQITSRSLKGSALLWTSGANKDLKFENAKKETGYIEFHVTDYDSDTGIVSVEASQKLPDKLAPPAAGDQFVVVGSVLQHGRKLYLTHCMHCHGVSGDGNGPTAQYLNPRPRDYRQGIFKFASTFRTDKACRADLARTILQGIPGTYMPSFLLLKDDELHAIVEYVRWLSMRGELEQKVVVELEGSFSEQAVKQRVEAKESRESIVEELSKFVKEELPQKADDAANEIAETWTKAEEPEAQIIPKKKRTPDDAASRARGRELYLSAKAKCATCHGPLGRGDGPQTEDFMAKPGSNDKYDTPGLYDDWGQPIQPRNLTSGVYRGGRRPIDIYRRIRAGVKGTPMPPFTETTLNEDEAWDLVNYVLSIPYAGSPPASHPPAEKTAALNTEAAKPDAEQAAGNVAAVSESGGK